MAELETKPFKLRPSEINLIVDALKNYESVAQQSRSDHKDIDQLVEKLTQVELRPVFDMSHSHII